MNIHSCELKKQINAAEEFNTKEETIFKKSYLVYIKDFTFDKYHSTKEFAKGSFYSKRNVLIEFKNILELFYDATESIKPNNRDQEKYLEKRKSCE